MSHNARSHNVLLKVTLPKRTGRKRKRGTDDPWQGNADTGAETRVDGLSGAPEICSNARQDDPRVLRRKLVDNAERYSVEAVGIVKQTHRFRGFSDFLWDMSRSDFTRRYVDEVLPGDSELAVSVAEEPLC